MRTQSDSCTSLETGGDAQRRCQALGERWQCAGLHMLNSQSFDSRAISPRALCDLVSVCQEVKRIQLTGFKQIEDIEPIRHLPRHCRELYLKLVDVNPEHAEVDEWTWVVHLPFVHSASLDLSQRREWPTQSQALITNAALDHVVGMECLMPKRDPGSHMTRWPIPSSCRELLLHNVYPKTLPWVIMSITRSAAVLEHLFISMGYRTLSCEHSVLARRRLHILSVVFR